MLATQVRPESFDEIVGNDEICKSLQEQIKESPEERPHTFLFSGPSGCGKTTLARIFAKEVGCTGTDLAEINAANTRGIDGMRAIALNCSLSPMENDSIARVYILDESHELTANAQQCLLKTVEDAPKLTYFIFCTTAPEKLIKTLRNRCTQYQVSPLRKPGLIKVMQNAIVKAEYESVDDELIKEIANIADGCPRSALHLLEQTRGMNLEEAKPLLIKGTIQDPNILTICRELVSKKNASKKWDTIRKAIKDGDLDPEGARRMILSYMSTCLLGSVLVDADRYAQMISILETSTFYTGKPGLVRMLFDSCVV